MSDQANYQLFLDGIFGKDTVSIVDKGETNNVIGALCHPEYAAFADHYSQRLQRLFHFFRDKPCYQELLSKVREVADTRNWDGAYAELVAYDVLTNLTRAPSLELEKTLPADASYTLELGGKETNEDGFLSDFGLYFDVKRLGDTVQDILQRVIMIVLKNKSFSKTCHLQPEFQIDDDDEVYEKKFNDLVRELDHFLVEGTSYIKSSIIHGLSYKVVWGAGVSSAVSSFDPYRYAENCRNMIFERYTKKILKKEKFFLILVNFPWYNNLISDFGGCNEVFYRSLARRTFCGYMHSDTKMRDILKGFSGDETVFEVSRHISGLMFIEDKSILQLGYSCYTYLNPNAYIKADIVIDYLQEIVNGSVKGTGNLDTFLYDNY